MSSTALIIGGDHVDRYKAFLLERGFASVAHWDGRRKSECHRRLPQTLDLIVIMIDQVSHGLLYKMRRQADEQPAARDLYAAFGNAPSQGNGVVDVAPLSTTQGSCTETERPLGLPSGLSVFWFDSV